MNELEAKRIESCPCGFRGNKKLLVPEAYENQTLLTCPNCHAMIFVEVSKKEFDRVWIELQKNGNKEDIANFLRRFRVGRTPEEG